MFIAPGSDCLLRREIDEGEPLLGPLKPICQSTEPMSNTVDEGKTVLGPLKRDATGTGVGVVVVVDEGETVLGPLKPAEDRPVHDQVAVLMRARLFWPNKVRAMRLVMFFTTVDEGETLLGPLNLGHLYLWKNCGGAPC
jgi:hypothetical protein